MRGFTEIAEGFWYEADTGLPWSTRVPGVRGAVGELRRINTKTHGYYTVGLGGKMKKWHRLVWIYFNGPIPEDMEIDHRNNVRDDNRLENLQLLCHKANTRSRLRGRNNTTGYTGVGWDKEQRKWSAHIRVDGILKRLGRFSHIEEAEEAYLQAKIRFHGPDSIRFREIETSHLQNT